MSDKLEIPGYENVVVHKSNIDTTNEEKARQIAIEYEDLCVIDLEDVALKAMLWKDEQHQAEKQKLIEKACEEHCNCCGYAYMACRRYNYDNLHCHHYIKFKKSIERRNEL